MALKRRVEKSYSVDEMFELINKQFIIFGNHDSVDTRHYNLSSTCFQGEKGIKDRYIMSDSRDNQEDIENIDDLLPVYYGSTIDEVVTKCFIDRKNRLEDKDIIDLPDNFPLNQKILK